MKITYDGFFRDRSGFGEAARRTVFALRAAGADVRPGIKLEDEHGIIAETCMDSFLAKKPHEKPDVQITHCFARDFGRFPRKAPIRVGATCWETDTLPDAYLGGCQAVDHIIVPSFQNLEVFWGKVGKTALTRYPVIRETDMASIPVVDQYKPSHVFFSVGTFQPRKNFQGLLAAYLGADIPDTSLLVLVIGGTALQAKMASDELGAFVKALRIPSPRPGIALIRDLTLSQMSWLNNNATYVTATHGEGFGFPIADACAAGAPIIAPNWGGHVDVLQNISGNARVGVQLIPSRLTPVTQDYEMFNGRMNWGDPDLLALRAAIERQVHDQQRVYTRDLSDYEFKAVGESLLATLGSLTSQPVMGVA